MIFLWTFSYLQTNLTKFRIKDAIQAFFPWLFSANGKGLSFYVLTTKSYLSENRKSLKTVLIMENLSPFLVCFNIDPNYVVMFSKTFENESISFKAHRKRTDGFYKHLWFPLLNFQNIPPKILEWRKLLHQTPLWATLKIEFSIQLVYSKDATAV